MFILAKMEDVQNTQDVKPTDIVPRESQTVQDSGSISVSSNDNRKVSREDIELVQNLIERCLQLYMNRDEVVKTLLNRARIDPAFTTLVWQKLEEENADFFRAYYIRLKLKKQIVLFNNLLEHQYHVMKYPVPPKVPLAPMQNGVHPRPVNNFPVGYPVAQQPPVPATGQPHINAMGYSQVVDGFPAPGNFLPAPMNGGNNAMSSMSDMPVSPTSVASSGHFSFSTSEIPDIGVDTSALDTAFTSDVASSVGLELTPDNGTALSSAEIKKRLAGISVYKVSNTSESICLLHNDVNRAIQLFFISGHDACDFLDDQVGVVDDLTKDPWKILDTPLCELADEFEAGEPPIRLVPVMSQVKSAIKSNYLKLYIGEGKKYSPAFLRKEDLDSARYALLAPNHINKDVIQVSTLEDIIKEMKDSSISKSNDVIFVGPGISRQWFHQLCA
ncbi:protein tic 22-like chloroplastic [Phtheirospermum japonicum]|uniref:Protein tic 22-like chloroplastic n=1 Tax=Phtheirospermum japonicum TaxID=374723 RepID=A0A830C335_9LAMI|nr:protein tic 22-like chloroplastic [Phtheirospermum japonicum]